MTPADLAAKGLRVKDNADAYDRGLVDALGIIASLGYGASDGVDRGHEEAFRAVEKHLADWRAARIAALIEQEGEG
jgi:hypothetical protein